MNPPAQLAARIEAALAATRPIQDAVRLGDAPAVSAAASTLDRLTASLDLVHWAIDAAKRSDPVALVASLATLTAMLSEALVVCRVDHALPASVLAHARWGGSRSASRAMAAPGFKARPGVCCSRPRRASSWVQVRSR